MASPDLPEDLTVAYPPSGGEDPTAQAHRDHHNVLHALANQFDYPVTPGADDFLLHNGTTYVPTGFAAAIASAVQAALDANASVGNTVTIFGASSARVHPTTGNPLPAGTTVLWDAETAPINFQDGTDIWINRPAS